MARHNYILRPIVFFAVGIILLAACKNDGTKSEHNKAMAVASKAATDTSALQINDVQLANSFSLLHGKTSQCSGNPDHCAADASFTNRALEELLDPSFKNVTATIKVYEGTASSVPTSAKPLVLDYYVIRAADTGLAQFVKKATAQNGFISKRSFTEAPMLCYFTTIGDSVLLITHSASFDLPNKNAELLVNAVKKTVEAN